MGLFDYVADIGKKLFYDEDEAGDKIKKYIEEDNPGVSDVEVEVNDGVAKIKGQAENQSAWQKAILMTGNLFGVKEVDAAELQAPPDSQDTSEVEIYEVKRGDTLWKISTQYFGTGTKYTDIFEANREVIKDPDLIFPGQKIRIPKELP